MLVNKSYFENHLGHLNEDDKPDWGILSPQHMVEHLSYLFQMSIGEIVQEIVTPDDLIPRYQKSLYNLRRLPKFFKNPHLKENELENLVCGSLAEAKVKLYEYIEKYNSYFENDQKKTTAHVIYGYLNKEKWDLIHLKHADHHFRQFKLKNRIPEGYVDYYTEKNGIGMVEFFHPAHNALPSNLLKGIISALDILAMDKYCQVIVLKSGGNRTFCAGANFSELMAIDTEEKGREFFSGFANVINAMKNCKKIIIGRVQGKAVGGGVGIVAATDYCFATKYASVKLSELNIGIGPFVISPAVERKIGKSSFSQLMLDFNNFYNVKWAQEKGLYHNVFENEIEMDKAILEFSSQLAITNPEARSEIKKMMWAGTDNWGQLMADRAEISGKLVLSEFTKQKFQEMKFG